MSTYIKLQIELAVKHLVGEGSIKKRLTEVAPDLHKIQAGWDIETDIPNKTNRQLWANIWQSLTQQEQESIEKSINQMTDKQAAEISLNIFNLYVAIVAN